MIIGGLVGIVIALAEEFLPKRHIKWVPSAIGLGIAGVIPASNSISMFIGAFIGMGLDKNSSRKRRKPDHTRLIGLIAGESLTGVAINLWQAAPAIGPAIWHFFSS